ncbi:hypothetical protein HII36_08435 [Nonomuraea sp. NN258]|uniref:hypothetical protein n=1 Tax=Nonomuraea antri TaxID=2730852 RepID=UPI001568D7BA|nr:hypothetical protein [Nonomuraea antri]NRQ31866.1 hypothetical protein [Nonomuraea antri]
MSRTVLVKYQVKEESADANQHLVEQVFQQLHAEDPGGLRYATLRLADGVTFVHIALIEGDDDPLSRLSAFGEFRQGLEDRVADGPGRTDATLVGAYRFLTPCPTEAAGKK